MHMLMIRMNMWLSLDRKEEKRKTTAARVPISVVTKKVHSDGLDRYLAHNLTGSTVVHRACPCSLVG